MLSSTIFDSQPKFLCTLDSSGTAMRCTVDCWSRLLKSTPTLHRNDTRYCEQTAPYGLSNKKQSSTCWTRHVGLRSPPACICRMPGLDGCERPLSGIMIGRLSLHCSTPILWLATYSVCDLPLPKLLCLGICKTSWTGCTVN